MGPENDGGKRAQQDPTRLVKGNQWVFIVPKNKGPRRFLGGKRGIGGGREP